jgi:NAD(P)H dehydrogenase (quinone)
MAALQIRCQPEVSMQVLMVFAHPRADSLSAALRDAARAGLEAAGHVVELRDLYAEGFRAELSAAESAAFRDRGGDLPDLRDHTEALRGADALVLVHPTWWFGMPAILKGWFERVWSHGVAFQVAPHGIEGLLPNIRRIAVVTTYGSPWWVVWWVGRIDRRLVRRGIAVLCAKGCRVEWLALTRLDNRRRDECEAFVQRVRAHFARW